MMAGSAEFIARCVAAGAELSVVSHKGRFAALDPGGTDLRDAARAWLARHCREIPGSRIFFEDERAAKLRRIGTLGLTHFIDDLPEVLGDPDFPAAVTRLWLVGAPGRTCPPGIAAAGPWPTLSRAVFEA